jgi:hypothetical protein
MRHEVTVLFDARQPVEIPVDARDLPAADVARRWLDDEFTRLDCTPLRASGKVLTVDKLLAVAAEAGEASFEDPVWRQAFARAACAAMGKPVVTVDLVTMAVRT